MKSEGSKIMLELTYSMKKATTAKVSREPCQCLVHSRPDLLVVGIPVVRQVVLPTDVAKDCNTA